MEKTNAITLVTLDQCDGILTEIDVHIQHANIPTPRRAKSATANIDSRTAVNLLNCQLCKNDDSLMGFFFVFFSGMHH